MKNTKNCLAALCSAVLLASGLAACSAAPTKANTVGDKAEGEHYAIAVLDAVTADRISGVIEYTPDEGNEYLLMAVEVENLVDEERHLSWPFGEAEADGKQVHIGVPLADVEIEGATYGPLNWNDPLYKGDTVKTYLSVEVPTEWQTCEYDYDGVHFTVNRDQVSAAPQQAPEKAEPETTPTPEPTPTPTPAPKRYDFQEKGQTESYAVTLLDGATIDKVWESDYRYYEAGAGKTFLILAFEIENTTKVTQDFWPAVDFEVSVDDYQCENRIFGFSPPHIEISGVSYEAIGGSNVTSAYELGGGKKVRGYIAAEIPKDGNTCEVAFDGAIFSCAISQTS